MMCNDSWIHVSMRIRANMSLVKVMHTCYNWYPWKHQYYTRRQFFIHFVYFSPRLTTHFTAKSHMIKCLSEPLDIYSIQCMYIHPLVFSREHICLGCVFAILNIDATELIFYSFTDNHWHYSNTKRLHCNCLADTYNFIFLYLCFPGLCERVRIYTISVTQKVWLFALKLKWYEIDLAVVYRSFQNSSLHCARGTAHDNQFEKLTGHKPRRQKLHGEK